MNAFTFHFCWPQDIYCLNLFMVSANVSVLFPSIVTDNTGFRVVSSIFAWASWTRHLAACPSSLLKSDILCPRVLCFRVHGSRWLIITVQRSLGLWSFYPWTRGWMSSVSVFPPSQTAHLCVSLGLEFLAGACVSNTPVVFSEGLVPTCPPTPHHEQRARVHFSSPASPALSRARPPLPAPLFGGKLCFRDDLICRCLTLSPWVLSWERRRLIFRPFFPTGLFVFLTDR